MLEPSSPGRRVGVLDPVAPFLATPAFFMRPVGPQARFTLRLDADDAAHATPIGGFLFAQPINHVAVAGDRKAARLGPDEWLLLAPPAEAAAVQSEIAAALAGRHYALVDIGHRNVGIELGGPAAAAVLNAGCPLDLDRFAPGSATRTLLGKVEIVLLRLDADGELLYHVECWRSFGRHVQAYLAEAARRNAES